MSKVDELFDKVDIRGPETFTEADYCLCVTADCPRYFADDIETQCCKCGTGIRHRPSAPAKAQKICLACVAALAKANPQDVQFATTAEAASEAIHYLGLKKEAH
jgi:hypothetical protein